MLACFWFTPWLRSLWPAGIERGVRRGRCRVIPASFSHSVSLRLTIRRASVCFSQCRFRTCCNNGSQAPRPWLREPILFALASAGFLLRTAGMALLAAWVLEALARRHWRLALTRGLLALLPILPWQIHVAWVRGSYEYAHPAYEYQRAAYQFYNVSYADNASLIDPYRPELGRVNTGALIHRVMRNLWEVSKAVGETIGISEEGARPRLLKCQQSAFGRKVIPLSVVLAPIIAFSILVIAGIGLLVHRRAWTMVFVLFASLAFICTTPWPDRFQRYLMPLTPFLAIAAMLALSQSYTVLRPK